MQQRFGPFEVIAPIAQGGQGAVLRAVHTATGRAVALKLLLRADPKSVRRFRQEAQVLTRLDHPSIVRVLEHGEEQGVPFLAMALVEGESVRALVARAGPPSLTRALEVVEAIARALAHCHERGVVHRDLKPDNVLLERASGLPVVVDFGLLQRDPQVFGALSIDEQSRLSLSGELKGTPSFMAPEQASPRRQDEVGPATDVYALGATLYFLLTGEAPHVADSLPRLLYALLEGAAPDPRARAPWVPESVARLCVRSLARAQADRPASAAAFADEASSLRAVAATTDAGRRQVTPPSGRLRGGVAAGPRPGDALGPYDLMDVLGRGGMGTVFRARHRVLGVVRAVKVLTSSTDPRRRARFEREVQGLARVRHEHVVGIHETGADGATLWFAMDLVEGRPLDKVMEGARLPAERALAIAIGISRGVEALHELGIVHRDIKPQNVILGDDDRPVVIDLGLAVDPERDERLTRTGAVLGTVRYMAPEQLAGKHSERADVYAIGLIALELLTGRPAFADATSITEITARILTEDRPRPSDVDPSLGAAIDAVVVAACSREPARRPARAGALADALERAARAPGPSRAARRARGRRLVAVAALALAAVTASVAGAGLLSPPAERPAPAAPGPRPAPSAGPSRDDARALEAARREAREVLERGLAPEEQHRRAAAWLERHAGAPDEPQVRAAARDARRRFPVRSFAQSAAGEAPQEARVRWVDDARVVSWGRFHDVVRLWDLTAEPPRLVRRWSLGPNLEAASLTPGPVLLVGGAAPGLMALALDSAAGPQAATPLDHPVTAVDAVTDARLVVVGGPAGRVGVLERRPDGSYRQVRALDGHASDVGVVSFSPDATRLVTGSGGGVGNASADNLIVVWDATTWTQLALHRLEGRPNCASWSADGALVAVGTSSYRLHLVDGRAPASEPVELHGTGTTQVAAGFDRSPPAHGGAVREAAFTRDGAHLLSVSGEWEVPGAENGLRVWSVAARAEVVDRAVPRRPPPVSIELSPDGTRAAIGFHDGTIEVWSAE